MHSQIMPLADCPRETLAAVQGVLTDIDETLSTRGRLTAEAYGALETLQRAGLLVIPVTGRPAGWCDHIARFWPVDAVVGENGAFWMWRDAKAGKLRTRFVQGDAERAEGKRRLEELSAEVRRAVPGAGIIAEYLDETHAPRLHPADPVQRAINRAWLEYLASAVDVISRHAYGKSEAEFDKAAALVPTAFEKLEKAMARQSDGGPFFNGAAYSLVDAAYAPFLQRHLFLERIRRLGHIERFPRVKAWAEALAERPSTHSFPPAEFEAMYRDMVKRRNKWISRFVDGSKAAAE